MLYFVGDYLIKRSFVYKRNYSWAGPPSKKFEKVFVLFDCVLELVFFGSWQKVQQKNPSFDI